jgi:hypothetical protein
MSNTGRKSTLSRSPYKIVVFPMRNVVNIKVILQHKNWSSIPEKGLYFFPGKDFRSRSTEAQEAAFEAKFKTGPVGILVYRPVGGNPFSPNKLMTQLTCNFISTLILAFIVSLIAAPYWKRVFAISLLGCLACVSVSTIYWNWYEFPTNFFLAQCVDQIVGCFLAGLAIARIVPPSTSKV